MTEPIPRLTEASFDSDPITREIRRLALVGSGAFLACLRGDESNHTANEAYGAARALRQWDITDNMHERGQELDPEEAERREREIMSNPRLAAEYAAGQFLARLRLAQVLYGPSEQVLNEHDRLDAAERQTPDGEVRDIDLGTAPDCVKEYLDHVRVLAMLTRILGHTGGRLHDRRLARGHPYQHLLLKEAPVD